MSLQQVHTSGRVHSQLSPSCIALTKDGAQILKPTGLLEDSEGYRAPEQLLGEDPDARSDVFAYGAIIYEIVSGKRAFPGTGMEVIQLILTGSPEPLGARGPICAAIEKVIASCLEKDPSRRRQRVQNAVIELKLASAQAQPSDGVKRAPMRLVPAANAGLVAVAPVDAKRGAAKPAAAIGIPLPAVPPFLAKAGKESRRSAFRRHFVMIGAAVLALAAASAAAVLYLQQRPAPKLLRFTVTQPEHTSYPGTPSISPGERRLARLVAGRLAIGYSSKQDEAYDIFARSALPGSKPELLVKSGVAKYPNDWSHDGARQPWRGRGGIAALSLSDSSRSKDLESLRRGS